MRSGMYYLAFRTHSGDRPILVEPVNISTSHCA